jgi:predicted phage terminase large subunit-like protein
MHEWMAERLDAMGQERGVKLNVLGPRGGAKSTVATLAYPLRAALEAREPYIWIVSDTKQQAHAHLENLKAELVDNTRVARDYPRAAGRGPIWRAGAIVLRNGVTVEAFGAGQRLRGRRARQNRPTLIVCDDLQNDGHIESARQRAHARQWFHGTLLKAGTPLTNIVNLATALHREALAMELVETPGWTSRVFRSIDPWPFDMARWEQWETIYADRQNPQAATAAREFYKRHRQAMDAGAAVLWPQVEDLYTLMCMRAESGRAAFEREKQNSPLNPELCEWPETYFQEPLWFDQWPQNLRVKVLALDPSKGSDSRHGDFSAFIRLGIDRQGMLYVEGDLARRPTPQIVADGVEHYRQFRPDAFGVEANQFQHLLGDDLTEEFRRQGLLGVHPWLIQNDTNKRVRIRRLGPLLAAHRVRFKTDSPATRLLLDQLKEFPIADHDDGPDALEMALRLAQELLAGVPNDGLGDRLPVGMDM